MSTHIFGEAAEPTMPDLAVDGNLEAFLLQLQQQQSAQATVQQEQATKQQEQDRLIQSLQQRASDVEEALNEIRQQQSNSTELAATASPGPARSIPPNCVPPKLGSAPNSFRTVWEGALGLQGRGALGKVHSGWIGPVLGEQSHFV